MAQEARLARFVELVRRELDAADARVEFGGKAPEDPRALWCNLPRGWRIVVVFTAAPRHAQRLQQQLESLGKVFFPAESTPPGPSTGGPSALQHELDGELALVAEATGADSALIVDLRSPVLWAASARSESIPDAAALHGLGRAAVRVRERGFDLADLIETSATTLGSRLLEVGVEPDQVADVLRWRRAGNAQPAPRRMELRMALAVAAVRDGTRAERPTPDIFVREVAGQYRLIVSFPEPYNELRVVAAARLALPRIERLLLSLPPPEPPREGARVIQIDRRPRS